MPDDVPLSEALSSIAAAVVAAGRYLRSATSTAAGGFALDTVSLDLNFVVTDVVVTDPSLVALPPMRFVRLGPRERSSLERAATEDALASLADFLGEYERLETLYRGISSRPAEFRGGAVSVPRPLDLDPLEAELEGQASRTALDRLRAMRAQFAEASAALATAAAAVSSPADLRVRVDAGGFDGIPDPARQRMHVAFRGGAYDVVTVEGDDVVVPT